MSPAISRIIADPNRDLLGIMSNGMVITRNVSPDKGVERAEPGRSARSGLQNETRLSDEEKALLDELKERDREVRLHEQKHMAAAGTLAKGGPTFEYAIGPDGKPYAIGGKVRIDTSPVPGDPEATAARANQIRLAAMAPGDPSAPDMLVANEANSLQSQAQREYRMNGPESKEEPRHLKLWG
ncbi:MAG: putative metalloprotease CJM1_0395 family protein [Leptospiraceae bacterium]